MTARPLNEQDFVNARQTLNLLRSQISAGRFEQDYLLRQLDKLGTTLESAEAQQKTQKSAGRFEALYNVSRMLGASLDETTVLNQVMDAVIQITGAERGFLMLRDDDGNLRVRLARNIDQQSLSSDEFRYSRTVANNVLESGKALLTTNAVEDPRFAGQASIVAQALKSIMVAPLMARGKVIGIAYVENRIIAGLFSDDDLAMLEALAGQASIAIENARLFAATDEALNARLEELRELRRIDLKLNEKLDPDEALRTTLDSVCQIVKAQAGFIVIGDKDGALRIAQQLHFEPQASAASLATLEPAIRATLNTHKAGFGAGDNDDEERARWLFVPFRREERAFAVLVLLNHTGMSFNEDQLDLVERIVSRAAVTLENARLYKAVKAADIAKSEFVGIVAHDLKTPMTSIRGYADLMMMQSDNLDERQKSFLDRIINTVERMRILVSDLADLSRIESGHFSMDERRISAREVVEAVRDTTMPEILAREHHFVEQLDADLPDLHTDYYRLIQVLINLVSNAYKYTPHGGTITLHVQNDRQRVRFAVQDTGIGLDEEQLAKLGTKFWRASDDFTRSQNGTGLGFAITSSLVQLMGSKIEISSRKGVGSTFAFSVAAYRE